MADDNTGTDKLTSAMPTLFISYASEDRVAARLLRDAIGAHGIDVWYDEDELSGGDAWDQKIRQRIRACDFFMPVISHATQARREGYFRREWRQATERTLDMDDDMMFLLPVNIDDIPEAGSRVPERFTHVHWTRCLGGESNANLEELCRRVLAGDNVVPAVNRSGSDSRPPVRSASASSAPTDKKSKHLPPYPDQPHRKATESAWLHAFNLLVWLVQCAYRAYRGFPRILRWVIIAWLVVSLINQCNSSDEPSGRSPGITDNPVNRDDSEEDGKINNGILEAAQELRRVEGLGELGRIIGAVADAAQAGRPITLAPFNYNSAEATNEDFTKKVYNQLIRSLRVTRADEIAISPPSFGANPSPTDILARIARTESRFLLTGWTEIDVDDNSPYLEVVLYSADSSTPTWTRRFAINTTDAATVVDHIRAALTTHRVFAPPAEPTAPSPAAADPTP